MKEFKTKVKVLDVPIGTKVSYDETRDNIGISGKFLCTVPGGGGVFYSQDEIEEI